MNLFGLQSISRLITIGREFIVRLVNLFFFVPLHALVESAIMVSLLLDVSFGLYETIAYIIRSAHVLAKKSRDLLSAVKH